MGGALKQAGRQARCWPGEWAALSTTDSDVVRSEVGRRVPTIGAYTGTAPAGTAPTPVAMNRERLLQSDL
jgi:hypothetical protein